MAPPTWPRVCVSGERSKALDLTAEYVLDVHTVRLQGDGHHTPIVGTIAMRHGALALVDDAGRSFALDSPPADLTTPLGRRIWLLARYLPETRTYAVLRFGTM